MELDVLEQTITIEGAVQLRRDAHGLSPAPIPPDWILEGSPAAREKHLAGSSDQRAATIMWDCTAGRFNRLYDTDEVIHVLEGSAVIEDVAGVRRRLQPGDTVFFPAGSRYHWAIPDYIRHVAFRHSPLSPEMRVVSGIVGRLSAAFRRKPPARRPRG